MTKTQNQTVFASAAEAYDFLRGLEPDFLERAPKDVNGSPSYICPECGNGSGGNGTGIARNPKTGRYKCFRCLIHEDYVGLFARSRNLDSKEALREALAYNGASLSSTGFNPFTPAGSSAPIGKGSATAKPVEPASPEQPPADYRQYYKMAVKRNEEAGGAYLLSRGISLETQRQYGVGYDSAWVHPEKPGRSPFACVVFPMSQSSYSVRSAGGDKGSRQIMDVGRQTHLFGEFSIMKGAAPGVLFVVEGPADAMSVCEAGGRAVALNGTNYKMALEAISRHRSGKPGECWKVIIFLDDDNAGQENAAKLETLLRNAGELCIKVQRGELRKHKVKDANELLRADRGALEALVKEYTAKVEKLAHAPAEGLRRPSDDVLDLFMHGKKDFEVSTGFAKLDEKLHGGLREGLYIIGAISSLGKTTFCLQMADQIARAGTDVLFFSLEMSERELVSKTLSRMTYQASEPNAWEYPEREYSGMSSVEILQTHRYSQRSPAKMESLRAAKLAYSREMGHLYIHEGRVMEPDGKAQEQEEEKQKAEKQEAGGKETPSYRMVRINAEHIKDIVKRQYMITGRKPVVFIDYLQILAPLELRMSDKQATDATVFVLKELSREMSIPVIAVSSFNRDNYTEPVSMVSFKESGAIEYSSDVLFGLQYRGMEQLPPKLVPKNKSDSKGKTVTTTETKIETESERRARLLQIVKECKRMYGIPYKVYVELKCLKNRSGQTFETVFALMARYNCFWEISPDDASDDANYCPPAAWDIANDSRLIPHIAGIRREKEKKEAAFSAFGAQPPAGFTAAGGDIPDQFK